MEALATPLFRMEGISKRYGGVNALTDASLAVEAGHIHAILGENGAGKSTLIKIIAGVIAADLGRMMLDEREVTFASPAQASRAGIACVFQELSLIPDLTVADNIFIGDPPRRFGLIDRRAQRRMADAVLARPARPTFIQWRRCAICLCRAGSWSRLPRRWRATRAS